MRFLKNIGAIFIFVSVLFTSFAFNAEAATPIGKITIKVANLNVRSQADFTSTIVKVVHQGQVYNVFSEVNGLYNAGGNQWITASSKYVDFTASTQQLTYLTLTKPTDAYNTPNGAKVTHFAPQTVTVLSTQGSWNEISTRLGPLWIDTAQASSAAIGTLSLTTGAYAYNAPNGTKITHFAPQTVNVLATQGLWYQIRTGLGPLWVNMSTLTLSKHIDAYNTPDGGKITTFGPQTVNVISIQGDWYQIKTSLGSLWVNPKIALLVPPTTPQSAQTIINFAEKYMGMTYIWASSNPINGGFDCSGFIYYVYKNNGYYINRLSVAGYWNTTKHVTVPQPGDLVIFKDTYAPGPTHMGIYIGNDQMVDAQSDGVSIDNLSNSYWKAHFLGYARF